MKQKTILIDIDGVLADFVQNFTRTAKRFDPSISIVSTVKQPSWIMKHTMEQSTLDKTWNYVDTTPGWWLDCFPLVTEKELSLLKSLQETNEVVFCTGRGSNVCDPVSRQSIEWLECLGIKRPSLICSKNKGEIARAIRATHSIEDKPANASMIHWLTDGKCKSYLITRPYNQNAELPERVRRVLTVEEFLEEIK